MTEVTTVPFSKLTATDAINARPKGKDGIDELSQSIATKGIIQPLCVRPGDTGATGKGMRYEVIDGRRRFQAIQRLVKDKTWSRDTPVPVLIRNEDDAEALETSLVANTVRLPMHPIDQHEVFARLAGDGRTPADIAARFGIEERTVRRHMALGRLAPVIREAWRKGTITAETAQAFCAHPSQQVQAEAFEKLKRERTYGNGLSEHVVRRELAPKRKSIEHVPAAVLDAYTSAGGTLTEDLFADESYADDGALLDTCLKQWADAQTAVLKARVLELGWSWVAREKELDDEDWSWHWPTVHDDDPEDDERDRGAPVDVADLEARSVLFTAEEKARSGVVIKFFFSGEETEISLNLGIVRPGDEDEDASTPFDEDAPEDDDRTDLEDLPSAGEMVHGAEQDGAETDTPAISGALLADITAQQTEAVAAVVSRDPILAGRLLVAALRTVTYASPAKLSIEHTAGGREETNASFARNWKKALALEPSALASDIARVVASSLALGSFNQAPGGAYPELIAALDGDGYLANMRRCFLADDYFRRASKATALAAIAEMQEAGCGGGLAPEDVLAGMKKGELAAAAAEAARACGWLPAELRHPAYSLRASGADVVPEARVPHDAPARGHAASSEPAALTGKMAAAEQTSEVA